MVNDILKSDGKFRFINTTASSAFAYTVTNSKTTIIVIGNLNYTDVVPTITKVQKLSGENMPNIMQMSTPPVIEKGQIKSELNPGEIQVLIFENFSLL